jgi:hypothetical protein
MANLFYSHLIETKSKRRINPYVKQSQALKIVWNGRLGKNPRFPKPAINFGILRFFLLFNIICGYALPINFVRFMTLRFKPFGRNFSIELYVLFRLCILGFFVFSDFYKLFLAKLIAIVILIELFFSLFNRLILIELFPPVFSHKRTFLLLMINFLEQIFAFSVLYLNSGGIGQKEGDSIHYLQNGIESIYFSCITALTVGYGDFHPITHQTQFYAIWQVLSIFTFITVIFQHFQNNLSDKPMRLK